MAHKKTTPVQTVLGADLPPAWTSQVLIILAPQEKEVGGGLNALQTMFRNLSAILMDNFFRSNY